MRKQGTVEKDGGNKGGQYLMGRLTRRRSKVAREGYGTKKKKREDIKQGGITQKLHS